LSIYRASAVVEGHTLHMPLDPDKRRQLVEDGVARQHAQVLARNTPNPNRLSQTPTLEDESWAVERGATAVDGFAVVEAAPTSQISIG